MIKGPYSEAPLTGVAGVYYNNKDDIRFEIALETAENMRTQDIPYIVVNSSPEGNEWVDKALTSRGADVIRAEVPGIASQRIQGVRHATENGAEKILSQEPEKTLLPFFKDRIARELDVNDILVIGRTEVALQSLPETQLFTEHLAGWILEKTHGLPSDSLSGGRGFNVSGADELSRYPFGEPGMNNWIYLYDTPIEGRKNGLRVAGVLVDLIHPPKMTLEEDGNPTFERKRFDQFKLQLDYLLTRPDVNPNANEITRLVLSDLRDITVDTHSDTFRSRIENISAQMSRFGYTPTK